MLAGFLALFTATQAAARLGFLLDTLCHTGYRDTPVEHPVFIIGNPRSGTTFLHRLLAQDAATFTTMRLWEILFAPSVTQRRLIRGLAVLDRRLGSPLRRAIAALDARAAEQNAVHSAQLLAPEEDQFVLLHIWSALAIWHFSGILEEAGPYTFFDAQVPQEEKQRVCAFHRRAIRCHLYAAHLAGAKGRTYLAKDPSASAKVDALLGTLPDARFVYVARNPLEMIPSMVSCLDLTWRVLGSPLRPYAARDYVVEMAKHWYTYPLTRLAAQPEDSYAVVTFGDLTRRADRVVRALYDRFDLPLSDAFARTLAREAEAARAYRSPHRYDLTAMGLSRESIVAEFGEVFDRFGFDRSAP